MTAQIPSDIANLDRWWKADAITGLADGAAVSSWTATTGGVALAQATSAKRPVYRASVTNLVGKPAVDFDGTDNSLTATITSIAQPTSYFLVLDLDQGSTTAETQLFFHAGGHEAVVSQRTANTYFSMWGGTNSFGSTSGQTVIGAVAVFFVINGASSAVYNAALSAGTLNSNTGTTGSLSSGTGLVLGEYGTPATHPNLNGRVAEFGRYSAALTSTQAQNLFEGFQAKYATSGQSLAQTVGGSTTTVALTTT